MYSQSISHSDGYNKVVKQSVQHHLSSAGNRHSSSSHMKDARKSDVMQRQKSGDKGSSLKTTSHSSKSSEHKPLKVQGALRTCGNWSEHRSSSGKIYFYNTVSETSQWEKPKEWNEGTVVDVKSKDKSKPPIQRSTSKPISRHPSSSKAANENDKDYRHQQKDYCDRDYRNKSSTDHHDYKDIDYRSASAKPSQSKNNVRRSVSTDKDYRTQQASNSANAVNNHNNMNTSSGNAKDNYVPSTGKFYDYSTWNTASNSETKTVNGITVTKPNEAFLKSEGNENPSNNDSKNSKLSATSEFVRKLSTVLNQAATTSANPIKSEENIKDVFQLLLDVAAKRNAENVPNDTTVKSESSELPQDSVDEPPSKKPRSAEGSSKHPSESSEPTVEPEDRPFKCLDELRPLFDPTTITHVLNWPTEHNEKQCVRMSEDFHRFIADQMSDLSVQLTTARSQVRTSEILSTLHEQRVLYIRQQIQDLEKTSTSAGPFT